MKAEYFVLISVLFIILISVFLKTSGYLIFFNLNVSVSEKKEAKILLGYKPIMDIVEKQNITAEIINTGSLTIEEEMFIRIYYYNKSLVAIGEYWDSLHILKPGERNVFRITFVPESTGTYFIQAKAKYDGRTTETWGRIDVLIYPIYHYVIQPPKKVEKPTPVLFYLTPPKLDILTNDSFKTYFGSELIIPIIVKNLGDRDAYELRPYVSYPSDFQVDIYPNFVKILSSNKSVNFLLKVKIPLDYQEGIYQLFFEIVGNETAAKKTIDIYVEKFIEDLTKDYKEKILSLEFLISEIRSKVVDLSIQGYDVSELFKKIEIVESYLVRAKSFLEVKDYENCYKYIMYSINLISEILMEIENAYLITPKAYENYFFIILFIVIIIAVILFIVIYLKKRKEKRPKILKEIEAESIE
ncbi:MAG: hypothetical protein QXX45_03555 [Candidatus Aenigmatarchaeota archaeon]